MTMPPQTGSLTVSARNIGGIDTAELSFEPGVTILTGRNATNRTSLLRSVMAAFGSDHAYLKSDADEGEATVTVDGQTYSRTFERVPHEEGETVERGGNPYLDDPLLADLFAFLLEDNDARNVVNAADIELPDAPELDRQDRFGFLLREVLLRPVDTEQLERRKRELQDELADVESKLSELAELERTLPELRARRDELESELAATRETLAEKRADLEAADESVEASRAQRERRQEKLDELEAVRSDLYQVERNLETERETLSTYESELTELETELDERTPEAVDSEEESELTAEIERLRGRRSELEATANQLQSVIEFNEEQLRDDSVGLGGVLHEGGAGTEGLVTAEEVVCWTCGSEVDRSAVEDTLERLRSLHREKVETRRDVDDRIQELRSRRADIRERRERLETLERDVEALRTRIENKRTTVAGLTDRKQALEAVVDEHEDEFDRLQVDDDYAAVLELQKEVTTLEHEVETLEEDVASVQSESDRVEQRLEERESLEARQASLESEKEAVETREADLERDLVERFNETMEELLARLAYANLERIWIERAIRTVSDGRRKTDQTVFRLHVVRESADGAGYEERRLEHLSESERELVGLVFALSGYLVYDVGEEVPVILLDSLEAIDAQHIDSIITYFSEHAEYVIVALLPEDERAVDDEYDRIAATDM